MMIKRNFILVSPVRCLFVSFLIFLSAFSEVYAADDLAAQNGAVGGSTKVVAVEILDSNIWHDFEKCQPEIESLRMLALHLGAREEIENKVVDILKERVGFDVSARGFAMLVDAINVNRGNPQIYGTQLVLGSDGYALPSDKEKAKLNEARDILGIEPIEVFIRGESDAFLLEESRTQNEKLYQCHGLQEPKVALELMKRSKAANTARSKWSAAGFEEGAPEHTEVNKIDEENAKWITGIVQQGLLDGASIGRRGLFHAFLLLQHSADDALMKAAIPQFRNSMYAGTFPRSLYSMMIDRLLVLERKEQVYGSQGTVKDGRVMPSPIRDEGKIDGYRSMMMMLDIDSYYRRMNGD